MKKNITRNPEVMNWTIPEINFSERDRFIDTSPLLTPIATGC